MTKPWLVPYVERFKDRKPRVFIAFMAFGDIYPEVFESAMVWAFQAGRRYRDTFEVVLGVYTRREQYRARNAAVKDAQQANADFIVMLDDDHTLSDCPDFLGKFFDTGKPLQGALYVQRQGDFLQPVIQRFNTETRICEWIDEMPTASGPVDVLGGGMNWIDMTVFDFMSDPFWWPYPAREQKIWFRPHPRYGLDMHFCLKVREELEIQPWLNFDVQVGHAFHEHAVLRPPGLKGHQQCDACDGVMVWDGENWNCQTCENRKAEADAHRLGKADFAHRETFRAGYPHLAGVLCRAFSFEKVLDVGAGQGFLVDELVAHGKDVRGVEREAAAVEFMSPTSVARIAIGDATNGACPDEKFDLVTCVEVAEHVEPEKTAGLLDALARTTERWLFFTADDTPSRLHVNLHSQEWWRDALACRGFEFDDQKTGAIRQALKDNPLPWFAKNAMIFQKRKEENANG